MFGMITYINTNLLVLQGNYESLVLVRGVDTEVTCFAQLLSLQGFDLLIFPAAVCCWNLTDESLFIHHEMHKVPLSSRWTNRFASFCGSRCSIELNVRPYVLKKSLSILSLLSAMHFNSDSVECSRRASRGHEAYHVNLHPAQMEVPCLWPLSQSTLSQAGGCTDYHWVWFLLFHKKRYVCKNINT